MAVKVWLFPLVLRVDEEADVLSRLQYLANQPMNRHAEVWNVCRRLLELLSVRPTVSFED